MGEADQFLEGAAEVMAALDDVPSPAALLDVAGIIRWQNKASLTLRGRRVGSPFIEFIASHDQPRRAPSSTASSRAEVRQSSPFAP